MSASTEEYKKEVKKAKRDLLMTYRRDISLMSAYLKDRERPTDFAPRTVKIATRFGKSSVRMTEDFPYFIQETAKLIEDLKDEIMVNEMWEELTA